MYPENFHFDAQHAVWRESAGRSLLHNRHNLDAAKLDELLRGLDS